MASIQDINPELKWALGLAGEDQLPILYSNQEQVAVDEDLFTKVLPHVKLFFALSR